MMKTVLRWRLRIKDVLLWWGHTWWFQWAHNPLCGRFEPDVLRIGRLRLCRSCFLVYAGLILAGLALLWFTPATDVRLLTVALTIAPLVVLSYPKLYHRIPRRLRDVVRFATGVFLAFFFSMAASRWWWLFLSVLAVLVVLFFVFRANRRQVKKNDCRGCPELGQACVCSGYAAQSISIRRYERQIENEWNRPEVISLLVIPARTKKR